MSDNESAVDNAEEKHLKLKSVAELRGPEGEDDGKVYSEMLRQLQIDPEKQKLWFKQNLLMFRKQKDIKKLILKGDTESLRSLSDKCLRALGKLTWANDRLWLLPDDQLDDGEQPLVYKLATERQEGDHDRFYPPMEAMWKEMRNRIYTMKRTAIPAPSPGDPAEQRAHPARKKRNSFFYFEPQTYSHSHIWVPISPHPDEIVPAGKWSENQTEEAILHIVRTLNDTRLNSDGQVFERVFQRFMARLSEIEYVDDLQVPNRGTVPAHTEHEPAPTANGNEDTEMGLGDIDMDELQADHDVQPSPQVREKTVFASRTQDKHGGPMSKQSQAIATPLSGSLLSYLPAAYPATMSAYITPFPSSSEAVPYHWVDAPCLPSSYSRFVEGIVLRANVPKLPRGRKLVIVLAYGWNDFCRVLRNEQDWTEGFQKDIRRAAEGDRVDVWRLRVCCFA